jgi:hypothetical protein
MATHLFCSAQTPSSFSINLQGAINFYAISVANLQDIINHLAIDPNNMLLERQVSKNGQLLRSAQHVGNCCTRHHLHFTGALTRRFRINYLYNNHRAII